MEEEQERRHHSFLFFFYYYTFRNQLSFIHNKLFNYDFIKKSDDHDPIARPSTAYLVYRS